MIGQIVGSLGGLAKSYIDAKTAVKITEAEIKKKQLTGKLIGSNLRLKLVITVGKMSFGQLYLFLSLLLILFLVYKKLWHEDLPTLRLPPSGFSGGCMRPLPPRLESEQ